MRGKVFIGTLAIVAAILIALTFPAATAGDRGACVSACEERRQEVFQKCLAGDSDVDRCARHANTIAEKCKRACAVEAAKD